MTSLPVDRLEEPAADALAVAAIREGDRDRYRELVERYADKVFAVAWCRLGDRSLAEEAAQEAFIAGYRRLALLGRAERFGAWITTIARRTAINLGLRRRGELRRQQRWALEQDLGGDAPVPESDPAVDPESLRPALASLPARHRECLALFYLENRSVAEAAGVLGISENAFKVRLHRARAALRDALESRLETGLGRLRASPGLASSVMLALPAGAPASGWLATGGLASLTAKVAPLQAGLLALQVLASLPGLLLAWWIGRRELANFREPSGFRGQLHRRFVRSLLGCVAVCAVALPLASHGLGLRAFSLLFGGLILVSAVDYLRRFHVVRHPLAYASAAGFLILAIPMLGITLFAWPWPVLYLAQGGFFLVMSIAAPASVPRMDQSLFVRALHGLLDRPDGESPYANPNPNPAPNPAPDPHPGRGPEADLAFARFLARHLLVDDWRREPRGLRLRLARVTPDFTSGLLPFRWGPASHLRLSADGSIQVRLGEADRAQLAGIGPDPVPPVDRLEAGVAAALLAARVAFVHGDPAGAARRLGEVSEDSIFRRPPVRSLPMRWRVWTLRVATVLMPLFGVWQLWFQPSPELAQARWLQPVRVTEPEVHAFLAALAPNASNHLAAAGQFGYGLTFAEAFPGAGQFPPGHPDALEAARTNTLAPFLSLRSAGVPAATLVAIALDSPAFQRAALHGLFSVDDLTRVGLDSAGLREGIRGLPSADWQRLTGLVEGPVPGRAHRGLAPASLALRVRYLERFGALDLADLAAAVEPLAACQILPRNPLAGRWPVPDRKMLHGLFAPQDADVLVDTRDTLIILAAAGALDRIDRVACVDAILRLHRGRGLFAPPSRAAGGRIRGDARCTQAALDSLRILGALDRVRDLPRWEFRPPWRDSRTRSPDGTLVLSAEHLEAWCLDRAFRESLHTHAVDAGTR